MGYTVTRNDAGAKDSEFEAYSRLLLRKGIDLGNLPRVPDPTTGCRWLYVWDNHEEEAAQNFANELNKLTSDNPWIVLPVDAPPSEGPIGPIIIQVGRRADGLVFGLHPLSRATIQSAFPNANVADATVSIRFETLQDFRNTHGGIEDLASTVVPTLTGLDPQELVSLGYALIEDDTNRTLVFERPGDLVDQT